MDPASVNFLSASKAAKDRDKSNEVQHSHGGQLFLHNFDPNRQFEGQRRPGQKEPSCLLELNKLKKEINEEIRREVREGKHPPLAMSPDGTMSAKNRYNLNHNATA